MPEATTDVDAHYALGIVREICAEAGPGLPGSSQEGQRAAVTQWEMESHRGAENVTVEEFTFAPAAFLRASPISRRSPTRESPSSPPRRTAP